MRSRLLVAAVGVPALLYVVLWGPPLLMLAALALLAGIGGGELYHCAGGERDPFLAVAAVFIPCMTVGWYYSMPQYVGGWFILSTSARWSGRRWTGTSGAHPGSTSLTPSPPTRCTI